MTALLLSGACAFQRAYIAYDRHEGGVTLAATPLEGEAIGAVRGSGSGPLWKDCTDVARIVDDTMAHAR